MDARSDNAHRGPQDRLAETLGPDMEAVNLIIRERMASEHAPRIPEVTAHLIDAGGKRIRPMLVLAAAHIAGVDRVFTIGGAQAVGALAYGTETVPAVDKIVGPGNAFVAAAKRRVFGTVGIDMIAGPSEILVICDGKTPADWIAMDLFSQAEHDELAQSILLCPDAAFIEELKRRDPGSPTFMRYGPEPAWGTCSPLRQV